jgi:hypothetical protein
MVTFDEAEPDDESVTSSIVSRGELMNIISKTSSKTNLHPITILTIPDKNQHRVACTTLMDQCCTDNGIISWELAKMLDIPTHNTTPKTFITAAGTFMTDKTVKLTNAMLPCLSTNETLTLELMIIPKEYSNDLHYGAIIGQDSMRKLDIDTSVRHNTISWHDNKISMVSRDYWTTERILQQKAKLSKKPSQPEIEVADDKKIKTKEIISKTIDTTPTNGTNLKTKSPIQLEVTPEQYKIPTEDKPSKQKVYSTLLAIRDNKTQVSNMGKKSHGKLNSPTATHNHSYFSTQHNANKASNTHPTNKTWHIIRAKPNDNRTLPPDNKNNSAKPRTTTMTPPCTMTDTTNEHKLPMT